MQLQTHSAEMTFSSSSSLTLGDLITYAYDKMGSQYSNPEDLNLAVALWLEEMLDEDEAPEQE